MTPWLVATGQRWKLRVFLGLSVLALLLFVGMAVAVSWPGFFLLPIAGAIVGSLAFAWLALSIRCPACGGKPAMWALMTEKSSNWYVKLTNAEKCPICGEDE